MRYGVKDLIIAMLLGLVLGACLVAAGIADAASPNVSHTQTKQVQLDHWDMRILRSRLLVTCALRVYEDGSAVPERNDDARHMCREVVSQIAR